MHLCLSAERSRRSILFVVSIIMVLALCSCGASTAVQSGGNPNDILPATVLDANPNDFELAAAQTEEPGRWLFSVTRLGEPGATDGLNFAWDFGDAQTGTDTGTEPTHAFEEPGRHVIIVTAKTGDGTVAFLLTLEIDLAPFNRTPRASIGPDQTVNENASVFLDGSQSFDADGDEISYSWRQVSGPLVFLTGIHDPIVSFVTPTIDRDAQLVFTLDVSDELHTAQATTTVNVTDLLNPAGSDPGGAPLCTFTVALEGEASSTRLDATRPLTITATASTVADNLLTEGSYTWTFDGVTDSGATTINRTASRVFTTAGVHTIALSLTVAGVTVGCHSVQSATREAQVVVWPAISGKVISPAGDAVPGITVSAGAGGTTAVTNAAGEFNVSVPYRWSGVVTAQHTDFDFDASQVSFSIVDTDISDQGFVARPRGGILPPPDGSGNLAPFADAGSDQVVVDTDDDGFELFTLDGSASTDPDGSIDSFEWSENATSLGVGARIDTLLSVGAHAITLTVTDDQGTTATDRVLVLVTSPATAQNDPPIANAGPDQSVEDANGDGTEPITLNGRASSDADGTVASYAWFADAMILAVGPSPSVTLSVGVHTVTLVVTDDLGAPTQDLTTIVVTAAPPQNLPPIAHAGSDRTVEDIDGNGGEPVALDGRSSRDPDGTIVAYRWLEGGTTLYSGVNPTPTLTFSLGVHDLTLRVTDDQDATSEDSVRITVAAPSPAGDWYVDDDACVNPLLPEPAGSGSLANPFCMIQQAADVVAPGDTVYVHAGTYREAIRIRTSGTVDKRITFRNVAHELPVIDGEGIRKKAWESPARSYITIQGFELRNTVGSAILLFEDANFVTIRFCRIRDCGSGIVLRGADNATVEWNDIYNNGIGVVVTWRDTNSNRSNDAVIQNNLLYGNGARDPEGGDGIIVGGGTDAQVHHNFCWLNLDDGIDISGQSARFPERANVHHNVCFKNGYDDLNTVTTSAGDGNGIKVSTNVGGDHTVHHNLSMDNKRAGFDMDDVNAGWPNDRFYNNIAWRNANHDVGNSNKAGFIIRARVEGGREAPLRNNVSWGNNPIDRNPSTRGDLFEANRGIDVDQSDHNVWGSTHTQIVGAIDVTDVKLGSSASTDLDPGLFVNADAALDITRPAPTGYLEVDIPAHWQELWDQVEANFAPDPQGLGLLIDQGVEIPGITDGFQGTSPDIGMFEFAPLP